MKEKLEQLLAQAREALARYGSIATPTNRAMLEDMISQAETILRGEPLVHTSGSRAYLTMTHEDWCRFAIAHPVMLAFNHKQGRHETYGLQDALAWFIKSVTEPEDPAIPREVPEMTFEHDPEDLLLFTLEEFDYIRRNYQTDKQLRAAYEKIHQISDRISDEQLETIWHATWKDHARLPADAELFSDTSKGFTFSAPQSAAKMHVRFVFPDDRGWKVRKLRIGSADAQDQYGEEELIASPGSCTLASDVCFEVVGGSLYTLHFTVNQTEKLEKDIRAEVTFEDQSGAPAGTETFPYNRKAWYPSGGFNLDMQSCALRYALTGDTHYARKAIRQMLLFMDDFSQGVLHWLVYGSRPEGRDSYGAVQAGRNLAALAMTYVLVRMHMTDEETALFNHLSNFLMQDVLDLRDRTCLTAERAQRGTSNWQTDMCIGAAMLAAAVPGIPHRRLWILNAEAVLSAQMSINLNNDGSWPESLRYHHAALEHFCTFARFWQHETGENWFTAHRMDRMFAFTAGTQLPPCSYFDGRISTPPFGDHKLGNGSEYYLLGMWAEQVAQDDPQLGAQMLDTWQRAGCPTLKPWGESVTAELLLNAADGVAASTACDPSYRTQSRHFPDAGLTILRRDEGNSCLAVMCSPRPIGHGHLDQGSFIYYWQGAPLVMDTGIESYFDASTQWHLSSLSHACMLFSAHAGDQKENTSVNLSAGGYTRRHGWCDVPRSSQLLDLSLNGETQHIRMRIDDPDGRGNHFRQLTLEADGSVLIEDQVETCSGDVLFCLPMLVENMVITQADGRTVVRGAGYDGVDLLVEILSPIKDIWTESGRTTPVHPGSDPHLMPFLRVRADAAAGFTVRLQGIKTTK